MSWPPHQRCNIKVNNCEKMSEEMRRSLCCPINNDLNGGKTHFCFYFWLFPFSPAQTLILSITGFAKWHAESLITEHQALSTTKPAKGAGSSCGVKVPTAQSQTQLALSPGFSSTCFFHDTINKAKCELRVHKSQGQERRAEEVRHITNGRNWNLPCPSVHQIPSGCGGWRPFELHRVSERKVFSSLIPSLCNARTSISIHRSHTATIYWVLSMCSLHIVALIVFVNKSHTMNVTGGVEKPGTEKFCTWGKAMAGEWQKCYLNPGASGVKVHPPGPLRTTKSNTLANSSSGSF